MGPSWITVKNFKRSDNAKTWTKMDIIVNDMNNIEVENNNIKKTPPPPLKVLSLSMKTVISSTTHSNEVVLISGVFHPKVSIDGSTRLDDGQFNSFTIIRNLDTVPMPYEFKNKSHTNIKICQNERMMLSYLMGKINNNKIAKLYL